MAEENGKKVPSNAEWISQRRFAWKLEKGAIYGLKKCVFVDRHFLVETIDRLEAADKRIESLEVLEEIYQGKSDVPALKQRIADLEEIETDLNNTISSMGRGIERWKQKCFDLMTKLEAKQ